MTKKNNTSRTKTLIKIPVFIIKILLTIIYTLKVRINLGKIKHIRIDKIILNEKEAEEEVDLIITLAEIMIMITTTTIEAIIGSIKEAKTTQIMNIITMHIIKIITSIIAADMQIIFEIFQKLL